MKKETAHDEKTYTPPAFNTTYTIINHDVPNDTGYTFYDNTGSPNVPVEIDGVWTTQFVGTLHGINDTPYPEPIIVNFKPVTEDYQLKRDH